jgi:hypothetical protein
MAKTDKLGDMIRQLARPASGANPAIPGQVLKLVGANMDSLTRINPDLAARIANGDNEAIFDAYRMIVSKGEAMTRRGGPKAAAVMEPEYADVLGMGPRPARQMELPMGEDTRGLIPFGVRGGGVPVGGVRGPGSAVGGVGGPGVRRGGMIPSGGGPLAMAESRGLSAGGERGLSVPPGASEGWRQLAGQERGLGAFDDGIIDAEFTVQPRLGGGGRAGIPGPPGRQSRSWMYPAMGAAALGGAAALAARELGDSELDAAGDTAGLAAESRPVPSVESPMVDYSAMAREKIRQANEIQLREGRVTPESAALAREADDLYQKAAEGRRTGSQPGIMPVDQQNRQTSAIRAQASQMASANPGSDYRSQARRLLAELNARAREGNLTNVERQQMMQEINRLYALADEQANQRRAG